MFPEQKHAPKQSLEFYMRATHLRECIESLLERQEFKYGVRFNSRRGETEFTYCWQIMLAKN